MAADPRLLDIATQDSAIGALERRLACLPEAEILKNAKVDYEESAKGEAVLCDRVTRATLDAKRLEDEGTTLAEKIERVRKKLFDGSVTNPRELTSLQADEAMLERKQQEVEDLQLEVMMLLDDLTPQLQLVQDRLAQLAIALDQAKTAYDCQVAEIESDIARQTAIRDHLVVGIDGKLLGAYETVRRRDGIGAAALEGDLCTACHMKLTVPEVIEVKGATIGRCPNCDAILVLQ